MSFVFKPTRASRRLGRGLRVSKRKRSSIPFRRPPGRRAMSLQKYNVHMYKRMSTPTQWYAQQPLTAYNNVMTFDLSQVRAASELTALYDQYMITGVKVLFKMMTNPDGNNSLFSTTTVNSANLYPTLLYSRDYDNNSVETSNELRERNTTKYAVLRPNSTISIFLKPAIRNQVYLDGVTTATSPIWKQWLDCSVNNVPHYGLKFSVDFNGLTTNQDYYFRTEVVYYLKFKNAR